MSRRRAGERQHRSAVDGAAAAARRSLDRGDRQSAERGRTSCAPTRAMAQIENNIEAAQRRAALQYDRAVAEAKRTGRSQDVDGVTLSDEGVAGAKIDAESHVVDRRRVSTSRRSAFDLASSIQPAPSTAVSNPGAVAVIAVPSNTYRDGPREHRAISLRRRNDHLPWDGGSARGAEAGGSTRLRVVDQPLQPPVSSSFACAATRS